MPFRVVGINTGAAPHVCHDYRYLQGCTAIWVHFTGRGVRALLERFENLSPAFEDMQIDFAKNRALSDSLKRSVWGRFVRIPVLHRMQACCLRIISSARRSDG